MLRRTVIAASSCGRQVEVAYARLMIEPEGAAAELLAVAEGAIPAFEAFEDDRSLARVWMLTGYVMGGIRGHQAVRQDAEERALTHYRRTAFPTATCLQQLAAAIYWGPTPVPLGISRCTELSADETIGIFGRASILPFSVVSTPSSATSQGRASSSPRRSMSSPSWAHWLRLQSSAAPHGRTSSFSPVISRRPRRRSVDQCEYFERSRNRITLAARAAKLAETLYRQDRLDDAQHWAAVSRANTASDDTTQNVTPLARRGEASCARGSLSDARRARARGRAACR